ncbi:MAG: four helix bundle protein [Rickettsiales bacterium]|nr:four helix bundle protein [Rickettsiales bacterium]
MLSRQILRSGTSVGANLAEAECAASKKDFIAKSYIALKEINETMYWLRKFLFSQHISQKEFDSIYKDAEEIKKMLSAILRTLKSVYIIIPTLFGRFLTLTSYLKFICSVFIFVV